MPLSWCCSRRAGLLRAIGRTCSRTGRAAPRSAKPLSARAMSRSSKPGGSSRALGAAGRGRDCRRGRQQDANALQAYREGDDEQARSCAPTPRRSRPTPSSTTSSTTGGSSFDVTTGASLGSSTCSTATRTTAWRLPMVSSSATSGASSIPTRRPVRTIGRRPRTCSRRPPLPTVSSSAGVRAGDGHLHATTTRTRATKCGDQRNRPLWAPSRGQPMTFTSRRHRRGTQRRRTLDDTTGAQLWSTPIPAGRRAGTSRRERSRVRPAAATSTLYAFSAATGTPKWNVSVETTGSSPISSPSVANGVVYLGSDNGRLLRVSTRRRVLCGSRRRRQVASSASGPATRTASSRSANDTLWAFALHRPRTFSVSCSLVAVSIAEITEVAADDEGLGDQLRDATTDATVTALRRRGGLVPHHEQRLLGPASRRRRIVHAARGFCRRRRRAGRRRSRSGRGADEHQIVARLRAAARDPLVVTPPSKDFGNAPGVGELHGFEPRADPRPMSVTHYWGPSYSLTDNCSETTLASGGTCTFSVGFSSRRGRGRESGLLSCRRRATRPPSWD